MKTLPALTRRPFLLASVCMVGTCMWARPSHAGAFEDFFVAMKRDNLSSLLSLLLRGFDVNTIDESGQHGLHVALHADSLNVAMYLASLTGVNVNATTRKGETPLMIAALRGHLGVAQALIKRDADVNKTGWTPLHYAATHTGPKARELVALMLEHHAYIDAESPNGTTPLMMAAQYGEPEVLKLLLAEGADPHLRNQQKLNALDFAVRSARPSSLETLQAHTQVKSPPKGKW